MSYSDFNSCMRVQIREKNTWHCRFLIMYRRPDTLWPVMLSLSRGNGRIMQLLRNSKKLYDNCNVNNNNNNSRVHGPSQLGVVEPAAEKREPSVLCARSPVPHPASAVRSRRRLGESGSPWRRRATPGRPSPPPATGALSGGSGPQPVPSAPVLVHTDTDHRSEAQQLPPPPHHLIRRRRHVAR